MSKSQQVPERFRAAVERLDGNVDLLCEMAAITSEDLPDVTAGIESAIEDANCQEAASGLHKLKGMLSTFDADSITLDIQVVLDAARKGQLDEVRSGYAGNKQEIELLIAQITSLASSSPQ